MNKSLRVPLSVIVFLLAAHLGCMESAAPTIVPLMVLDPVPPTAVVLQVSATPAQAEMDEMLVEGAGPASPFDVRTVCAIESLNVRGGPGTNWSVLFQLSAGERVRVREWWHGWAMVSRLDYVPPYSPQWVNGDYLCL